MVLIQLIDGWLYSFTSFSMNPHRFCCEVVYRITMRFLRWLQHPSYGFPHTLPVTNLLWNGDRDFEFFQTKQSHSYIRSHSWVATETTSHQTRTPWSVAGRVVHQIICEWNWSWHHHGWSSHGRVGHKSCSISWPRLLTNGYPLQLTTWHTLSFHFRHFNYSNYFTCSRWCDWHFLGPTTFHLKHQPQTCFF